jgi:signal transduction histidine kinase
MSHSDSKSSDQCAARKATTKRELASGDEVDQLRRHIHRLQIELREQTQLSMAALEAQRESIARELHDNFGQYLTVMEMELGGLLRRTDVPADIRARMVKLQSLSSGARRDVGRIASQIRPISLDGVSLQNACLQLLADWKERSALDIDVHVSIGSQKLPALIETVLFRALQEAITNVVKHAKATRAGVILQALAHNVQLVVEDDGAGLPYGDSGIDASSPRLGLLGMRERLALVGGSLEIESVPGKGTTLLINVPL